jgi:hypothetical protein
MSDVNEKCLTLEEMDHVVFLLKENKATCMRMAYWDKIGVSEF